MQQVSASQLPLGYPAAIFPSRLEWLCLPEQIEQSLRLIYYLLFWKKARQHLLYADRQGLAEAQALILEHATKMQVVQPIAYLDGTRRFPGELLLGSVVENAVRGILVHLKGPNDPQIWPPFEPASDRTYKQYIRPLYKRAIGKDYKALESSADVLDVARLRGYIQERLNRLITQAKTARLPIPTRRLAALCIAPVDLLHIRENRYYFLDTYNSWGELDISDRRKLDPEGYSEIAFRYASANTEFVFHLPLRRAEMFVPEERLRALQRTPASSQERGIYQGQPISDEECAKHPAREILQDLGVDIARVCPHELQDRAAFLARAAENKDLWPTHYYEHEDWSDDPWDCTCLPPNLI